MNHSFPLARLLTLLLAPTAVLAAAPVSGPQTAQTVAVVKVQPNFGAADLAALAGTQIVEFPNGLRLTAAQVRSLAPLAERLRKAGGARSSVLRQPLTGPVVAIKPGTTMNEVLNAPDHAVLQLPDGRKLSVAQFRSVQGQIRRTTGARPQRTGPAVRIERGTPLAELLKRPDTDVLESPSGKRITVGELRRFTQHDSARGKK